MKERSGVLTAIPSLSASGSVAITRSALFFSAVSIAIFNASGSSGFGDFTVGKLPSVISCSGTLMMFRNPNSLRAEGISLPPVPWIGV